MADTTFIARLTNITASWCQDVNDTVYGKATAVKNFLQKNAGLSVRTANAKFLDGAVSPMDFGAVGDGGSHPLSGVALYGVTNTTGWTLTQWQAVFPHANALTNEIDWCAAQAALNTGLAVYWPDKSFLYDQPLTSSTYNQRLFGNGRLNTLTFNLAASGSGLVLSGSNGRQQVFGLNLVGGTNCTKTIDYTSPQVQIMWNWITATASGSTAVYGENENVGAGKYDFGEMVCFNFIHGSSTVGSKGVHFALNSQTSYVFMNVIDNFEAGVHLDGAMDTVAVECNVLENIIASGYGVDMRPAASTPTYKCVSIRRNHFEGVTGAIAWGTNGASGATYTSCEITGNFVSCNANTGYFLTVGATCGAGCANNIVELNDATNANGTTAVTAFFNFSDANGAASIISRRGNTVASGAWATGAQSIYAYNVRQVNAYFGGVASTGSFTSTATTRMECGNMTYRVALPWQPGEYLESIQWTFLPTGATPQVTGTLVQGNGDTLTNILTTGVQTGTTGVKKLITLPVNTTAVQGNNYYMEMLHALNGGTTAYDYPIQMYLRN